MYIVFRGLEGNVFNDPLESMMGMFVMSLGQFGDFYESFKDTNQEYMGIVCLPQLVLFMWHDRTRLVVSRHNLSPRIIFSFVNLFSEPPVVYMNNNNFRKSNYIATLSHVSITIDVIFAHVLSIFVFLLSHTI